MFEQENLALNALAYWYFMQAIKELKDKKEKR